MRDSAEVSRRLAALPRVGIPATGSILERWGRISDELGVEIWAKRDDAFALGLGGNKLRKLDLILGQALAEGVDVVLTTGGVQSNHCRLTAAAAARLGIEAELYLRDDPQSDAVGNLLLDDLFGARVVYTGTVTYDDVDRLMLARSEELRRAGRRPLVVPLGGATPLGTLGYVDAVHELMLQAGPLGLEPRSHIVAAGSGSTMAGLWVGTSLFAPDVDVHGVSVSWTTERLLEVAQDLGPATAAAIGAPDPDPQRLLVSADQIGPGYTIATPGAREALRLVARSEGVLLDLTYSAKAFAGLIELARTGALPSPCVFWHTGGIPDVFARPAGAFDY